MQTDLFLEQMNAKGVTSSDLAKCIGCSVISFRHKLSTGNFGSEEMDKLQNVLKFKDPAKIFFS